MPFAASGTRRLWMRPRCPVPDALPLPIQPERCRHNSGSGAARPICAASDICARRPHRHHLARCHRLDQSGRLGQPARLVRAASIWPTSSRARTSLRPCLGFLAERTTYRARHRRDESLPAVVGAWPVAFDHSASGCCRLARCMIPSSPAASMRSITPATRTLGFSLVATPSGSRWRREGGAHQSIAQPLIGMAQDGLAAFEPAFRRRACGDPAPSPSTTCRKTATATPPNATGCVTRPAARSICGSPPVRIEQTKRTMTPELRQAIVDGAYWLREPGPNCRGGRRLHRGGRAGGDPGGRADGGGSPRRRPSRRYLGRPAQRRLDRAHCVRGSGSRSCAFAHRAAVRRPCPAIAASCRCWTAIPPRLPGWARSTGHRVRPLGVEHFGQTGSIPELYRHYGIDANAIVAAAQAIAPGRPIRHLSVLRSAH